MGGEYHSVFKGRGMDFDEVREYVPGDEVRTIDWNVTARTGRPFVKKFTEERELTILLLVDVSASGNFGSTSQSKRELAAELASVLAFSAIRNSDKVGLILFTDQIEQYIPPKKGRRHVLRVIREILYFEPKRRGTDIVQALDFANRVTAAPRSDVFDFRLPDLGRPGAGAARHCSGRSGWRKRGTTWSRCTSRTGASMNCPTWACSRSRTQRRARCWSFPHRTRRCARGSRNYRGGMSRRLAASAECGGGRFAGAGNGRVLRAAADAIFQDS